MSWIKDIVMQLQRKFVTTDPFDLAALMNIYIVPWDLHEEISGLYKYDRRNKYIFINNNLCEDMQKFVCAHELGHAVLHPRVNTPFLKANTFYSVDKIEVEANTFAVELLMPDDAIFEYRDTSLSINEMAKIFGIPKEVSHLKTFDNNIFF